MIHATRHKVDKLIIALDLAALRELLDTAVEEVRTHEGTFLRPLVSDPAVNEIKVSESPASPFVTQVFSERMTGA